MSAQANRGLIAGRRPRLRLILAAAADDDRAEPEDIANAVAAADPSAGAV
jgi:hypothetical protein